MNRNRSTQQLSCKGFFLALLIMIIASVNALAQVIIPATTPDNYFESSTFVNHLNNSMINYGGSGATILGAAWENTGGTYFKVSDGITALPAMSINLPSSLYDNVVSPDIAFGGDNNPMTTSFKVCVTYLAHLTGGGYNLFMDIYDVTDPGTGIFAVTPIWTGTQITYTGAVDVDYNYDATPQIDMASELSLGGGMMNADKFMVTWSENTTDVHAMQYDFTTYIATGSAAPALYRVINAGAYNHADVAAIQRYIPATASIDIVGLFTYLDNANNVYYQEWDATTNTLSGPMPFGIGAYPRIDAIDPYKFNSIPNIAHYNITFESMGDVFSYNDRAGLVNMTNHVMTGVTGGYCVVACGPHAEYTTDYYNSSSTPSNYSQLIDWNTGNTNTPDFYQVNNTPLAAKSIAATKSQNAVFPDQVFLCWFNMGLNEIDFKLNSSVPPAYKHAPTNVATVGAGDSWQLFPDPATTFINLQASNVTGDKYQITDITGRIILQGGIAGSNTRIAVNSLGAGMYFMNVYKEDNKIQTIRFIKE